MNFGRKPDWAIGPQRVNSGIGEPPRPKGKRMTIQPIKLKDLVMIMGEDFELVIDRMVDPTAPGVKVANFLAQMTSEEATSLLLGLVHLNPDENLQVVKEAVDEKVELAEMDDLDAELDELMEWFDG